MVLVFNLLAYYIVKLGKSGEKLYQILPLNDKDFNRQFAKNMLFDRTSRKKIR